jgi:hypothetical protein
MLAIIQSKICLPVSYKNLKIKIYKTVILSVVLYGCEAWSLTLREEHGLRVFENRMLRIKLRVSKVFPVLFLNEHHAMKAYWRSGV